ncbi:MAG: 3-ketoacyl-CoA thiolase [Ilumatobacteraceae bacterium]|nr:3-ketoacyl-CoA thiolase [Ilumatobacteraceae bacterium]
MTSIESLHDVQLHPPDAPFEGPVPVPDIDSTPYWEGLRQSRLMITRCQACQYWIHPPLAGCPRCQSMDIAPEQVSGRATIYSFTVVNREFSPGIKPIYVVAVVDLVEQEALRLLTNIVNVRVGDIHIDMPVKVLFHDIGTAALALFEPEGNP